MMMFSQLLLALSSLLLTLASHKHVVSGFSGVVTTLPARRLQQQSITAGSWNPNAFTTTTTRRCLHSTILMAAATPWENKYFQLEELEDKEDCTTELFLKADRTIEFGETDGPRFCSASGRWTVGDGANNNKGNTFTMTLTRTYETGSSGREMGEFTYDLERRFVGELSMVGNSIAIEGQVYIKMNEDGEEVPAGYFNMIDATAERLGDDKKIA